MSAAAKVAAPRSLTQFRNFTYVLVAVLGINKGFREKRRNDAAWVDHQAALRKAAADKHLQAEAARVAALPKDDSVPAIIPEGLHDTYKEFKNAIQ